MDLALDREKSKAFNCSTCDKGLQSLRNCGGIYRKKALIDVNGTIYRECPRSLAFNTYSEEYIMSLYFDCKENKVWPHSGSMNDQTAYCTELFNFLDGIVNNYRERQHQKQMREMKTNSKS